MFAQKHVIIVLLENEVRANLVYMTKRLGVIGYYFFSINCIIFSALHITSFLLKLEQTQFIIVNNLNQNNDLIKCIYGE